MATVAAVLHGKMTGFSWTGFYLLREGDLTVGPYQGPLACLVLAAHTGVCWAGIDRGETGDNAICGDAIGQNTLGGEAADIQPVAADCEIESAVDRDQ